MPLVPPLCEGAIATEAPSPIRAATSCLRKKGRSLGRMTRSSPTMSIKAEMEELIFPARSFDASGAVYDEVSTVTGMSSRTDSTCMNMKYTSVLRFSREKKGERRDFASSSLSSTAACTIRPTAYACI